MRRFAAGQMFGVFWVEGFYKVYPCRAAGSEHGKRLVFLGKAFHEFFGFFDYGDIGRGAGVENEIHADAAKRACDLFRCVVDRYGFFEIFWKRHLAGGRELKRHSFIWVYNSVDDEFFVRNFMQRAYGAGHDALAA